jgi:dephospho-CoA kinase
MKIIGLTGGIASGKNFVAEIFRQKGAAVFDADCEVHSLLELDKSTILQVKNSFPESFVEGKIERKILGKIVFASAQKLKILEEILHPQVRKKYQEFLATAQKEKKKIAVLNIPLLLETQGYECDKILAITASPSIQKKRFLARARKNNPKNFALEKKNLEKKFEQIRSKQISNFERKSRADFTINSNASKSFVIAQVKKIFSIVS